MRESKLIKLLKTLSTEEFKGLYNYVRSPYFTKSKEALHLFNYIRKHHPDFTSPHLAKEKVFKKVFPSQVYSDSKLRNLRSKLHKIVENYLIQLYFEQEDFQKKKLLTEIYGQRNYYVEFERSIAQLLNESPKKQYRDASWYFEKYSLSKELYFHPLTQKHSKSNHIHQVLENLNHFYSFERLIIGIDLKNRASILSTSNSFKLEDYSEITPSTNDLYKLLSNTFHLQDQDQNQEQLFDETQELFVHNIQDIPKKYALVILRALLNFSYQQVTKKEMRFSKAYFDLFQLGLNNKLMFVNNQLPYTSYISFVTMGSKLKRFQTIQHFITKHEKHIDPLIRQNAKTQAMCILAFFQGEYQNVITLLHDYQPISTLDDIQARTISIRTYYYLQQNDDTYKSLFLSNCNAFEIFLKRANKINTDKITSFLNFISFLKKLAKSKFSPPHSLIKQLDAYPAVFARGWLMEEIIKIEPET